MKYVIIFILSLCFVSLSHGQAMYTQQDVFYEIEAAYVDSTKVLDVSADIYYHNNADVALDTIYLHLWMNALQHKNSPYGQQMLNLGSKDFYFSKVEERGGYTSIKVAVEDRSQDIGYLDRSEELMYVPLSKALQPGDSTHIHIDYQLEMPDLFTRMGASEESIQMMHWYPRVCVYDARGWHRFPYLAIGEMYGEVSHFMVQLDMPKEYHMSSTGALTGKYDLNEEYIRYQYEESNVIDFAIIASKNHTQHQSKIVSSISGKQVELIANYSDKHEIWAESLAFLEEAFHFMEKHVSPYPYDHLTLAETEKHQCNGMEYPCLMAIGCRKVHKDLEYYIIHEVAHQWFYGLLAFDERAEPWLDEGLATYYENRYTMAKYSQDHYTEKYEKLKSEESGYGIQHFGLIQQMRRHQYEAITTDPEVIAGANYGFGAYVRPAIGFRYLENIIGIAMFDEVMSQFASTWTHKHPTTVDLQLAFEQTSGASLDWLFKDWMQTDKEMDYRIIKSDGHGTLTIENKGQLAAPIKISSIHEQKESEFTWVDGFTGSKEVQLEKVAEQYIIDEEQASIDTYAENNSFNIKKKLKLYLGASEDNPKERELHCMPLIGYNRYDGFMVGLGLYNGSIGIKNFKYAIAPFYASSSSDIVGDSWMSYSQYLQSDRFGKVVYKLNAKSFNYRKNDLFDYDLRYVKIQPSIKLHFNHAPGDRKQSKLGYRFIYLNEERAQFGDGEFVGIARDASGIHELSYEFGNDQTINPYSYMIALEQQSYKTFGDRDAAYLKLTGEYRTSWTLSASKAIDFRLFAGYFLSNTERESSSYSNYLVRGSIAAIHQGFNDYKYDEYFFGREMTDARLSSQTSYAGGGFKTPLGSSYMIGQSNSYSTAMNIVTDTPLKLPIRLFMDLAYFGYKSATLEPLTNTFLYSAGLSLGNEIFQINLPLINSKEINDLYNSEGRGLFKRISFSLNINKLNPWDLQDNRKF